VRLQTYSNERLIAKAAGLHDADAAIAYAVEGWLLGEGDPSIAAVRMGCRAL
jgi:hypothetical protein